MPRPHPPEFRERAIELATVVDENGKRITPISLVAADLGISDGCLRSWVNQDAIDSGKSKGTTSDERKELVELRRRNRVLETEIEILKRAAAYFARENVLPK